jgi:hypothetical protein
MLNVTPIEESRRPEAVVDEIRQVQNDIMARALRLGKLSEHEAADIRRRRDLGLPFLDLAPTDVMPISVFRNWADLAQPPEPEQNDDTEDIEIETLRPELDIPTWLL